MVQVTGQLQDSGAKHSVPDGALVNPALCVNHWLKILEKVMLQKAGWFTERLNLVLNTALTHPSNGFNSKQSA